METKSFPRLLLLLFSALLLLLLTSFYLHLPYTPSETTQLQCSSFPSWCTSKNKIQNSPTNLLPNKPKQPISVNHKNNLPRHPLDPLTTNEISRTRSILLSTPPFSSSPFTIHSLVLSEPDKSVVVQWKKGDRLPPRQASVIALLGGDAHVATVDLAAGRVVDRIVSTASGYPTLSIEDMNAATAAPLTDSEVNRTVRQRGVDLTDVACLPISAGWFGKKEEGRRVMKVQCYYLKDTANFYMRPIEGLTVLVDLDSKQVVGISDKGKDIPIPKADNTEYRQSEKGNDHATVRLNPISIEQPKGPSFTIEDGHMVRWANWEFHLKADPRSGAMISQAKARDPGSGEWRSVMYKGFTSELFVPYMDPTDAWYFKTYMDAGEYGFGLTAMTLDPLNDCPRHARYMDGVFAAADGEPYVRENMICIFESYAGDIGWRHAESPITGMPVISS